MFPVRYELNIYILCKINPVFKLGALRLILTFNWRNIPFVNHVKYLSVIFDKRITWRLYIEMTEAKAFRTFIRIYSLFKSVRLNANITLTPHKALIRSVMTRLPRLGINGRRLPLKIAAPEKQGSLHHWKFSKVHTGPLFAHGFQPSMCIRSYNKIVQTTSRSHTKSWKRTCSQYRTRRIKIKKI
jgi:hypothetical protein